MKISEDELKNIFDEGAISRGYDYFNKKMVLRCKVVEQNAQLVLLKSEVAGSATNIYKQHIKISKQANKIHLSAGCTCPVGFNCKHVFAVCLDYLQSIKVKEIKNSDENNKVKNWLNRIVKVNTPEKLISDFARSDSFLIYRIFNHKNSYYKEDIKFYKAKLLKNGKLSKGTHIKSDNLLYGYSHEQIKGKEDLAILNLAKGIIHKSYSGESEELKGELGNILLKKMIKTNRCFYKESSTPLSLAEGIKDIEFFWEDMDEDSVKLVSNIDKDLKLLNTIPLMAIDKESNIVYEFKQNISGDLINQLNKSPQIKNDELNGVYEFLSNSIDGFKPPIPKTYKIDTIDTKPISVLRLQRNHKDGIDFHSMHLDFAYGEYLITHYPLDEKLSFLKDDTKVELIRDLEYEKSSIELIEGLGFTKYIENNFIYFLSLAQPNMQAALQRWSEFLTIQKPILEEQAWDIVIDDSFMHFKESSQIAMQSFYEDSFDWFGLSFDISFDGEDRPLVNLVAPLIEEFKSFETLPDVLNIQIEDNHFLKIDKNEIEPILKTIFALFDKKDKDGNIKVAPHEAHLLEDMDEQIVFKGSKELLELSHKLKNFEGLENIKPPKSLNATLRDYQQDGLNWLGFLHEFRFCGILADDMGLGKTIQTISHLSKLKEDGKLDKTALIIMPTSLIANWKNEIKKFCSNLSVLPLHGADRFDVMDQIKEHDVVLSTYALVVRDFEVLQKEEFSYIILDEAQKIKNPKTKMAMAIKSLKSEHKLALSGTPIENHLGELWSIFSFLMPGFLGSLSSFKKQFQTPIEKENDKDKQEQLNKRIKPFMIRRTKDEVADELPQKSEIIKYTQFDTKQSKLYETIRVTMEKKVKDAIDKKGLAKSHIAILDALLKLRQVCCDPSLLKMQEALSVKDSAKLELFLDLVDELLSEGKKILVFSQFTSMLSIIQKAIEKKSINYTKLTGSTKDREKVIDEFRSGDVDIFLISLKAGGVGLNLVEADTVIHYDPWWNPAVENQATDRAYRIGQTKAVFVYKLIVENTIEEKIIELQKKKQSLQENIYDDKKDDKDIFKGSELLELLEK